MGDNVGSAEPSTERSTTLKFFKSFQSGCVEFCDHTPIHGVPYVGQAGRTRFERILWFIILTCATSACVFLIRKTWIKWVSAPVLVDFSNEPAYIGQIPFPALTVCPGQPLDVHEIADIIEDVCLKESVSVLYTSLCANHMEEVVGDFPIMSSNCTLETYFNDAIGLLVPAEMTQMVHLWQSQNFTTEQFVDVVLTERGVCYSFNLLKANDIFKDNVLHDSLVLRSAELDRNTNWTLSHGFSNVKEQYPRRAYTSMYSQGYINLIINAIKSHCNGSEHPEGFLAFLHTPLDYPSPYREVISIPKDSTIMIYIKPNVITASDEVQSLPPEKRNCYFEHERYLQFFKVYTESNCELECLTNYTHAKCGCVPFHLPRLKDMKICETVDQTKCYLEAPSLLEHYEFSNRQSNDGCNCLPNCYSISYEAEAVHSSFTGTSFSGLTTTGSGGNTALIFAFFSDVQYWPSQRSKIYGTMDFIGDCGGLMGLCMGISVVSIIEILYYCTIRFIRTKDKETDREESVKSNFLNDEIELKSL